MITYPTSIRRRDRAIGFKFEAEVETNEARIRRMIEEYRSESCERTFGILADEAITVARNMDRSIQAMDDLAQPYRSE